MSNHDSARRSFLKSAGLAAGALAAVPHVGRATAGPASGTLKVGLVGCGGRGTGAATQALSADSDVVMWALGDTFESSINGSQKAISDKHGQRGIVDDSRKFVGLDAYQKVIDSGVDVVLLCTPPGFRPLHFEYAVQQGKHIFAEKPVAVDAPGIRSCMESAKIAKEKNLSVVAGFCWRYQNEIRDGMKQLHEGAIGDVVATHGTYLAGPVKPMPPVNTRPAGMGDVEWQIRNWYNFGWICGDSITEQAVHTVDKIGWVFRDSPPIAAYANGGRQVPANGGNIFDHFSVVYEYEGNRRGYLHSRQMSRTWGNTTDTVMGTKGVLKLLQGPVRIEGPTPWKSAAKGNDMYQEEHNELFASIRAGKGHNDSDWLISSSMLAILGRMAAYTGQRITWKDALASQGALIGDADIRTLTFDTPLPERPMAIPGRTELA